MKLDPHLLRVFLDGVFREDGDEVLVTCFLLTVFFDMVVAVSVGFVMAAVLFMRRMAEITEWTVAVDTTEERRLADLPKGVTFYEVNGPLFFGAAGRALESMHASETDTFHVLILHLGKVPVTDATGFAALESASALELSRAMMNARVPTPPAATGVSVA